MDFIKLHDLQKSFAEKAKETINAKTKKLGVKAVSISWDDAEGELHIRIMEEVMSGYTAQRVIEGLSYAKEYNVKACIELFSAGGDLLEAIAIYDYIKGERMSVECDIYGWAASAATVIASACNEISIGLNSFYLIHRATGGSAEGNAIANTTLENIYMVKTGMSRKRVAELLDANSGEGTMMTANEAVEMGFVAYISGADDTEMVDAIAAHAQYQFTNKTKEMTFIESLKNLFGVKADATDEEVLEAAKLAKEAAEKPAEDAPETVEEDVQPDPIEAKIKAFDDKLTAIIASSEAKLNAANAEIKALETKIADIQAKQPDGNPEGGSGSQFKAVDTSGFKEEFAKAWADLEAKKK
jgi:ATP-dependent protease ClpP protease subunit